MDRVGGLQSPFVVAVLTLRRKLLSMCSVEVRECLRGSIACDELVFPAQRLEQPPTDDFETFIGARWPPRRLDAAYCISQASKRNLPAFAADFNVLGFPVTTGIRGRQADHQQRLPRPLCCFGQSLCKGEMRLKDSAGKILRIVKLSRVRDPLIDQHQTGTIFVE